LNLAPGKLLVTLQVLVALRTGKLERVHICAGLIPDNGTRRNKIQCEIARITGNSCGNFAMIGRKIPCSSFCQSE
jgi:hypothetical protein